MKKNETESGLKFFQTGENFIHNINFIDDIVVS